MTVASLLKGRGYVTAGAVLAFLYAVASSEHFKAKPESPRPERANPEQSRADRPADKKAD